jgi:cytoskeleton protein RodZ
MSIVVRRKWLEQAEGEETALFPERVGDRLRAARVKGGFDLSDIASRTRVPLRQLEAIEAGDYSGIPSPTYCIGFVKAYARAVGEDEAALARSLREELGQRQPEERSEALDLDDADPARVPSKMLAWTAAGLALLVLIGYAVWRNYLMSDPADVSAPTEQTVPSEPIAEAAPVATAAAPTTVNPAGEVVLTATSGVWLRIYDAADKVLFEKEMATGERFVVPADANNPKIRTGRADLIAVTVGGKPVPALGPAERTVKDVGVSAAALAARPPVAEAVPTNGTPQP